MLPGFLLSVPVDTSHLTPSGSNFSSSQNVISWGQNRVCVWEKRSAAGCVPVSVTCLRPCFFPLLAVCFSSASIRLHYTSRRVLWQMFAAAEIHLSPSAQSPLMSGSCVLVDGVSWWRLTPPQVVFLSCDGIKWCSPPSGGRKVITCIDSSCFSLLARSDFSKPPISFQIDFVCRLMLNI